MMPQDQSLLSAADTAPGVWISPLRAARHGRQARVVVFPHSGAGPVSLLPLVKWMPDRAEVHGVTLPGRERRFGEPFVSGVEEIVAGVCVELDAVAAPPTYLFGHSMGASLAFAVAVAAPHLCRGLVISGQLPFRPSTKLKPWACDEELLVLLRSAGQTPERLLADSFSREHLLSIMRNDIRVATEAARITSGAVADAPLIVLGGAADPLIPASQLRAWANRTRRSCALHVLSGGHFFLLDPENLPIISRVFDAVIPTRPARR